MLAGCGVKVEGLLSIRVSRRCAVVSNIEALRIRLWGHIIE